MKRNIIYGCLLFILSINMLQAQERRSKEERIHALKVAFITEELNLTPEQSQGFWPLYNEYEDKKYTVNTRYFNLIDKFAENFENMSDEVATEVISESLSIELELIKLEKSYAKKFMKILTPHRTLKYLQAENKIKALIDAEMALQIPFLDEIED